MSETCTHESTTGVDGMPADDPDKLWRCDACGLLHRWTYEWTADGTTWSDVFIPVDPWSELAVRVEAIHRGAVATLNASEGSAEYAAVEASAFGHVLRVHRERGPGTAATPVAPIPSDALEQAVAEAIAVSLFGHEVGPSAVAHQIPEARAAIAAYVQLHSEARP